MRIIRACLLWLLLAVPAAAQEARPPILIIDSDRLYSESDFGRRVAADLAALATEVQAENDRIVETLTQEERSLTLRRPTMTPEAFRAESEAFDAKVQEVRRARDAKNLEFQRANAEARADFEERVQSILANIMIERGAVMVMEQRNVVLSIRAANITDAAIARINAELGDGSQ